MIVLITIIYLAVMLFRISSLPVDAKIIFTGLWFLCLEISYAEVQISSAIKKLGGKNGRDQEND